MDSEKISNVIPTINEWIDKFESNSKVSPTDKESIKQFRDGLKIMGDSMAELKQYHENEQDPARKEKLTTAIADSLKVQKAVEKFIDDCCIIEKHEGWPTIVGDARDVTFVNPPPDPLFFRRFFNNLGELTLILIDIQDGNSRRDGATVRYRS